MASGFFLGGAAEGIQSANKQDLADRTLAADTALRTRGYDLQSRGLDIQEKAQKRIEQQGVLERADKAIAETMGTVGETIKAGLAAGKDPQSLLKVVQPLVDSAKALGSRIGKPPASFDAQVQALVSQPGLLETATAAGTATAAKSVAEEKALQAAGGEPGATRWKDPKDRVSAENSLRDDFVKNSKEFVTVRDYYANFKSANESGAGDIARVFSFMKVLDPTSAVLPQEAANVNNAAGVPEAVRALWNRVRGGGTLAEGARKEIAAQVERIYSARAKQHDKLQTQFAGIAKRQGLRPDNVLVDLGVVEIPPEVATAAPISEGVTPSGIKFKVTR